MLGKVLTVRCRPRRNDGASQQFKNLGDDLPVNGKLTASKGLPITRKLLVFSLHITKATDATIITKAQWEDFFDRVEQAKALETGLVGLGKLVNKINGIEKKQITPLRGNSKR